MAQGARNPNSIFDAWTGGSKALFWIITLLCLASTILLNVPLGLATFVMLFLLSSIWNDPMSQHPIKGMMTYGSRGYKIAEYMMLLKRDQRGHLFSPTIMLGFGPPEDDIHMDLQKHILSPPTRVTAWLSLFSGICLSFLDYFIHPYVKPLWDMDFSLPIFVTMPISALFFFMFMQVINAANRYHMASLMAGVDHVPAVMINKIPRNGSIKKACVQGAITAIIGSLIAFGVFIVLQMISSKILPSPVYGYIAVATIGLTLFIYGVFRNLSSAYREEFMFQVERREAWNSNWEYKKALIPFFEMEVPVPGEVGKPGGPPEGEEPGEPHVWVATFSYPMNGSYKDFAGEVDKIRPAIPNAHMICITPIPRRSPESGMSIPGTVSAEGFRVWWTDDYVGMDKLLTDPDITPEHKEIAVRVNIVDKLADIKGINRCVTHSHSLLTAPDSKVHVMKVGVVPPDGVTVKNFTSKLADISSAIGVPWVRVKSSVDDNGRTVVYLYIGTSGPNNPDIKFPPGIAGSKTHSTLLALEWDNAFFLNKVVSSEGKTPAMMMSKSVMGTSNQIVFDLPAGVSFGMVNKASDGLKTSSGNNFLEIHPGITDQKELTRKEQREIDRYTKKNGSISQFTAVASPTHPLEKVFLFSEYKDKLIKGRESGVTKIAWSPGVKANGTLAVHDFNADMPHLVLAGSSGSGKSVLIYSMLCQLISNNGPEDLQIWIIDPKIGYQSFENIDSVTRYVDSWTPDEDFFKNCRDLFHEAVEEMKRRNRIFRFAGGKESIDKLSVARRIGFERGPEPDGSPNQLINPYIFIIIDEAALLFAGATDPETKELQKEILYYCTRLARESRSAGLHMLISTQYPTKESIPSIIKQQSGRLGLKTQDQIASKVIIDTPGLEDLTLKGEGMLLEGSVAHTFRGFLLEDDKANEHSMTEILSNAPHIEGFQRGENAPDVDTSNNVIDMPLPDSSVFKNWDDTSAERLRVDIKQGKSDVEKYDKMLSFFNSAVAEMKEGKTPEEAEEIENNIWDHLTFDKFKELLT